MEVYSQVYQNNNKNHRVPVTRKHALKTLRETSNWIHTCVDSFGCHYRYIPIASRKPNRKSHYLPTPQYSNLFGVRWLWGLHEPFFLLEREEGRPHSNQECHFWSNGAIKWNLFEQSLQDLSLRQPRKACDGGRVGLGHPQDSGLDTENGHASRIGEGSDTGWMEVGSPNKETSVPGCLPQVSSLPTLHGYDLSSHHVEGTKS